MHPLPTPLPEYREREGSAFANEPTRDWAQSHARDHFANALRDAKGPAIANDSTVEQAGDAIARAAAAFPKWRGTSASDRANFLLRTAEIMHLRRDELAAIVVRESGKTWAESDADICEAIDFCGFYATEAPKLFTPAAALASSSAS